MLVLLLLAPLQGEKPYTIPLLAFANSPLPAPTGEPVWQLPDFPLSRTEREKENSRSGNAQVEWTLRGSKLRIVCPTTQEPFQAGSIYGFADERLDESDSADNKLGACRYGCLLTNDPKLKTAQSQAVANELARYWGIAKEFAAATEAKDKAGQIEYRFKFDGQKQGRLGNVEKVTWIGRLKIRQIVGWISASYIEQREEDSNGPAEEFWRSSLLSGDPQDAGNEAMLGPFETSTHP